MISVCQIKASKGQDPENFDEVVARADLGEIFDIIVLGKRKAVIMPAEIAEVPNEPELFE